MYSYDRTAEYKPDEKLMLTITLADGSVWGAEKYSKVSAASRSVYKQENGVWTPVFLDTPDFFSGAAFSKYLHLRYKQENGVELPRMKTRDHRW